MNPVDYKIWHCCISTHLTFQVSQGSVATDLRWGENFNEFLFRNSLLNTVVKKLRKSINICQSYRKNKSVSFFMNHSVVSNVFQSNVSLHQTHPALLKYTQKSKIRHYYLMVSSALLVCHPFPFHHTRATLWNKWQWSDNGMKVC